MTLKNRCLSYLHNEKIMLNDEFPKYEFTTEELFVKLKDFINTDFDGISENKIYRLFLNVIKEMIYLSFDNGTPKKYMRSVFKIIDNDVFKDYVFSIMKTKNIKTIINHIARLFVATWQGYDDRDKRLNNIIHLIDNWM